MLSDYRAQSKHMPENYEVSAVYQDASFQQPHTSRNQRILQKAKGKQDTMTREAIPFQLHLRTFKTTHCSQL